MATSHTPEQEARDMLERMGVANAQGWGAIGELAQTIAEHRALADRLRELGETRQRGGWSREWCVTLESHEGELAQLAREVVEYNVVGAAGIRAAARNAHVATLRLRALFLESGA